MIRPRRLPPGFGSIALGTCLLAAFNLGPLLAEAMF